MPDESPYEDLRSLGDHLRGMVPPEVSAQLAASTVHRARPRRSRSWVGVLAAAALIAVSNVALAEVSDSAIPGELLYPLDRAYEWITGRFGPQDHGPERITEALELVEAGDTDRALGLVNEILPPDQLMPRARALARQLMQQPELNRRYARILITEVVRRQMHELLPYGLALESYATMGGQSKTNRV